MVGFFFYSFVSLDHYLHERFAEFVDIFALLMEDLVALFGSEVQLALVGLMTEFTLKYKNRR